MVDGDVWSYSILNKKIDEVGIISDTRLVHGTVSIAQGDNSRPCDAEPVSVGAKLLEKFDIFGI